MGQGTTTGVPPMTASHGSNNVVDDGVRDCNPPASYSSPGCILQEHCNAIRCEIVRCDDETGVFAEKRKQPFGPRLPPMLTLSSMTAVGTAGSSTCRAGPLKSVTNVPTPHGGIFSGQVGSDGRPHGKGVQHYSDGSKYEGQWAEGAAHGMGELHVPGSSKLQTVSSQDGKDRHSAGSGIRHYIGHWEGGLKHGSGKEKYEDDAEYQGNFDGGTKEGTGILTWGNGASYSGDFHKGKFHGEGVLRWANHQEYSGQWNDGLMHGVGHFQRPDGRSHTGHYHEDKRHGPGVFKWPDGSACKGRWEDGKLHGSGTFVYPDTTTRHGRWVRGEQVYWTECVGK